MDFVWHEWMILLLYFIENTLVQVCLLVYSYMLCSISIYVWGVYYSTWQTKRRVACITKLIPNSQDLRPLSSCTTGKLKKTAPKMSIGATFYEGRGGFMTSFA